MALAAARHGPFGPWPRRGCLHSWPRRRLVSGDSLDPEEGQRQVTTVREFAERDIPAAVDLFARVSPEHGWRRPEDCESYFREMLFGNPWRDLDVPSWVAVHGGRLAGFYAVMPRSMLLNGEPIRAAIGCQFSVAPEYRRSLATLQLVQACLRGPQQLTLADGAHERSRRMWVGLGGSAPALYGLNWIHPLRPARFLLSLARGSGRLAALLAWLARPAAALADRVLARPREHPDDGDGAALAALDLDVAMMLEAWDEFSAGSALRPDYERGQLEWQFRQLVQKPGIGALRARGLRDGSGRMTGWYLYFARRGDIGEVVQVVAREGAYGRVLDHLLDDAGRQGVAALRGRLDPRHLEDHAVRHGWFRREGTCTLVHSHDETVLAAIRRSDAFLSRMEGEWWLRFLSG